jgi:hypothetical protein
METNNIRTSPTYPVRGATIRATCIPPALAETTSSLPASFVHGRNLQADLSADRKASAALPVFRRALDFYPPGCGQSRIAISW